MTNNEMITRNQLLIDNKNITTILEPVWNLLNIIKLKKGIIISNLTVN
ncbi:MAG: hypothetical protein H9Q65_04270 [Spiroplasma ixodetis]|nr:hypothetical protein [Spiroplasma ixodetis]MBP1527242.1 hypothetical protein [Spiroplasma ixodetis]MBP1528438.1 hypothetical protein [Spiroplasma ixodetis]